MVPLREKQQRQSHVPNKYVSDDNHNAIEGNSQIIQVEISPLETMLIDDDCDDDASFDEKYKLTSGAEHLLDEIMTVEDSAELKIAVESNDDVGGFIEEEKKEVEDVASRDVVDSSSHYTMAKTKGTAEGMMDIALLTANANQLRILLTYNSMSHTFYISVGLIVASLILQLAIGIGLILKSRMKIKDNSHKAKARTNDFLVGGVFVVTVINVFAAAFTTTDNVN